MPPKWNWVELALAWVTHVTVSDSNKTAIFGPTFQVTPQGPSVATGMVFAVAFKFLLIRWISIKWVFIRCISGLLYKICSTDLEVHIVRPS